MEGGLSERAVMHTLTPSPLQENGLHFTNSGNILLNYILSNNIVTNIFYFCFFYLNLPTLDGGLIYRGEAIQDSGREKVGHGSACWGEGGAKVRVKGRWMYRMQHTAAV